MINKLKCGVGTKCIPNIYLIIWPQGVMGYFERTIVNIWATSNAHYIKFHDFSIEFVLSCQDIKKSYNLSYLPITFSNDKCIYGD